MKITFSSRLNRASFVLVSNRASCIGALFGAGLKGGEYSVPGVVLLSVLSKGEALGSIPSSYWCSSTWSMLIKVSSVPIVSKNQGTKGIYDPVRATSTLAPYDMLKNHDAEPRAFYLQQRLILEEGM